MKLTYPPSHRTDDLRPLYQEYRELYPELFEEWLRIERKEREIGLDELKDIQTHIYGFLRERTEVEGHMGLIEGFVSFRKLIVKEYLGYSLVPGQD